MIAIVFCMQQDKIYIEKDGKYVFYDKFRCVKIPS